MPRISIITSLFRGSEFIPQFIENIKRQTIFNDCEFLIINANAGEVQEDWVLFRDFVNKNKNVFWYNLSKSSVYEAWNYGIKKASSELVGNWNIDDVRFQDSLEMQVGFMEQHPELDLCYGVVEEVYEKIKNSPEEQKQIGFNSFPCLEFTKENMLKVNSPHCFPVWRKKIHDEIGYFDTEYFSAADYEMWLRLIFKKGEKAGKRLNMGTGLYYRNPDGVSSRSSTLKRAIKEFEDIKENYRKKFEREV